MTHKYIFNTCSSTKPTTNYSLLVMTRVYIWASIYFYGHFHSIAWHMKTIRGRYYFIVFIIHDMLISDIYFVNSTAGVKVRDEGHILEANFGMVMMHRTVQGATAKLPWWCNSYLIPCNWWHESWAITLKTFVTIYLLM